MARVRVLAVLSAAGVGTAMRGIADWLTATVAIRGIAAATLASAWYLYHSQLAVRAGFTFNRERVG